MKTSLDDQKIISELDTKNIYESFVNFGHQFESGWHDAQFVNLGFEVGSINKIVFAGMGGSNLPAKIILSIAPLLLKIPFEIVANYRLPVYVDENTLVILSSYSGNTEEIISTLQDAVRRKSKNIVITTGGKLHDLSITEHIPLILLDEKYNQSRVPRGGLGIGLGALLSILVRLNQEAYRFVDTKEILRAIERIFDLVNKDRLLNDNPAKTLAQKHRGRGIIFISANHLSGVGAVMSNILNETGKTFCVNFQIPDLNHHLFEGMLFPTDLKDTTTILILNSSLYPEVIQKRILVTKDILLKQNYKVTVIRPETSELVPQIFESLAFLTMFSYYLSIANKVDPSTNSWVDYFKKQI